MPSLQALHQAALFRKKQLAKAIGGRYLLPQGSLVALWIQHLGGDNAQYRSSYYNSSNDHLYQMNSRLSQYHHSARRQVDPNIGSSID